MGSLIVASQDLTPAPPSAPFPCFRNSETSKQVGDVGVGARVGFEDAGPASQQRPAP
jgi:hypothetical protein